MGEFAGTHSESSGIRGKREHTRAGFSSHAAESQQPGLEISYLLKNTKVYENSLRELTVQDLERILKKCEDTGIDGKFFGVFKRRYWKWVSGIMISFKDFCLWFRSFPSQISSFHQPERYYIMKAFEKEPEIR